MTDIVHLAPHDPIPTGPGRHVVVLKRFDEDEPKKTVVSITLTGRPDETTHPMRPDGTAMGIDEAIKAAVAVAESEKLSRVVVADRTAGLREQDILQHGGDHTVHMDELVDSDMEDGEHGADMRDRTA
ncbi:MAG: hypothetical protein RQ966_13220 [Acetobacteraceae bacterium]|nr:hypothetical protein [Acetobacteraceae bacterium]